MPRRFYLRHKDTIIGYFVEREDVEYKPIRSTAMTLKGGLGYPLGLYPLDRHSKKLLPVIDYTPTREDIELWLSERVFPPDREGAWYLLEQIGLSEYDRWEIAKKTMATSYNDYYWMSENPDDNYEDISPRFKMEWKFAQHMAEFNSNSRNTTTEEERKNRYNFMKMVSMNNSEVDKAMKEVSYTSFDDDDDF